MRQIYELAQVYKKQGCDLLAIETYFSERSILLENLENKRDCKRCATHWPVICSWTNRVRARSRLKSESTSRRKLCGMQRSPT